MKLSKKKANYAFEDAARFEVEVGNLKQDSDQAWNKRDNSSAEALQKRFMNLVDQNSVLRITIASNSLKGEDLKKDKNADNKSIKMDRLCVIQITQIRGSWDFLRDSAKQHIKGSRNWNNLWIQYLYI